MGIIYSNEKYDGPIIDPLKCDATKCYLNHFENSMTLSFFADNSKDVREKQQAANELIICERKMKFWERQPHFQKQKAFDEMGRLKKQWER